MMLTGAIAVLAAATRAPAAQGYPAQSPTGFLDDFDGPAGSPPNPQYWTVPSWSIAKNMYLDGQSHLVVKNTGAVDNYTESKLVSQDKVTLDYGTFSASIKMPPGRGLWPAFWLLGGNNDTVPWPSCGEIDVIELISDGKYYCTIHGPATRHQPNGEQQQFSGPLWFDPTAGFHTYWSTHLEDAITFGIDSTTFGTMTPSTGPPDVAWPYNQPFYMILDLATGDGRWCPKPNAKTPFPAIMLVDWVKWEPAS
jgi:beta-glucanase (GH16 family)